MTSLLALTEERSVLICAGSGGVGKTTIAAAIAVQGARLGRRTCVVTIDPAKRLADALGLDRLTNQPGRVEGDWTAPGELWALMLDTKSTFDDLVTRYASDPRQAEGIFGNRLYRNISGALSGTQEYMAMEKLFELHSDDRFDLIVVDTPPTRNALDFLDAPRRLTHFLDNRVFRLLMMPTRAYMRAVSVATQAFLRTVSKVVGSEVVGDAVDFFAAFEGMEQGFRDRAQRVSELLTEGGTGFVLVAAPRRDSVDEALYFARRLQEAALRIETLVVNRIHPRFGSVPAVFTTPEALAGALAAEAGTGGGETGGGETEAGRSGTGGAGTGRSGTGGAGTGRSGTGGAGTGRSGTGGGETGGAETGGAETGGAAPLARLLVNLRELEGIAEREEHHVDALIRRVSPAPVYRVPMLATDVHDLDGLSVVGDYLFEGRDDPRPDGAAPR